MNRWITRIVTVASLAGAAALAPAGIAYAQQAATAAHEGHGMGHKMGLVGAALKLDSLTPAQRTAIDQLVQTRRTAEVPVRQADAQLLTVLAQPWVEVWVDGKRVSVDTPLRAFSLPAGPHSFRFVNADAHYLGEKQMTVPPGGELKVSVDVPKGTIRAQ